MMPQSFRKQRQVKSYANSFLKNMRKRIGVKQVYVKKGPSNVSK